MSATRIQRFAVDYLILGAHALAVYDHVRVRKELDLLPKLSFMDE